MATSAEQAIQKYVSDMYAVVEHVKEALERQAADTDAQKYPEAIAVIQSSHRILEQQGIRLKALKDQVGAPTQGALKEAITSVLGAAAGIYDKVRSEAVSKMLRDDYVALTMVAMAYEMLHTTGLTFHNDPVAKVALQGLREIPALVMAIGNATPSIVVKEFADQGLPTDTAAISIAAKNVEDAWRSSDKSEAAA